MAKVLIHGGGWNWKDTDVVKTTPSETACDHSTMHMMFAEKHT